MPCRSDIDPADIPHLLPFVILVDVVKRQPLEMRYRLVGTSVVELRSGLNIHDPTGHPVEDVTTRFPPTPHEFYRSIVETAAPRIQQGAYTPEMGRVGRFGRLGMPLSEDGETVNMILGGFNSTTEGIRREQDSGPQPR